jgi:hypothetical protein
MAEGSELYQRLIGLNDVNDLNKLIALACAARDRLLIKQEKGI